MKYPIFILAGAFLLSCGTNHENQNPQLEQLKAEKDSLNTLMDETAQKIEEINALIAKADTSKTLTKVTAEETRLGKFVNYFEVYGNVDSRGNMRVMAETNGEIKEITVEEGDVVKEGDVLMRIDDEVLRQNVEEVEAQLSLARDIYQRQKRLWDKNIGSEVQFIEAQNKVQTLEKRLAGLQKQLDMATVRAPVAGNVDKIFPRPGENAVAGMELVRIINLDNMYVEAEVSDRYSRIVQPGKQVIIEFPELDIRMDTTITRVGQFINPGNRTFEIKVDIDNPGGLLKPNLMALVKIKSMEVDSAVSIPVRTIQETPEGDHFIYVLEPHESGAHQVKKVTIDAGGTYQGRTLVKSGLSSGTLVIDKGSRRVQDGQIVQIKNQ